MLEFSTYRHYEHCGPNLDDHLNYRKNELSFWLKKCPINFIEKKYLKMNFNSTDEFKKYLKKIDKEINDAFEFAEKSISK